MHLGHRINAGMVALGPNETKIDRQFDCKKDESIEETHFYICSQVLQPAIKIKNIPKISDSHADSIEPPSQISNIREGKWKPSEVASVPPISQRKRNGMNGKQTYRNQA